METSTDSEWKLSSKNNSKVKVYIVKIFVNIITALKILKFNFINLNL